VEKHFITDIYHRLPVFMKNLSTMDRLSVAPLLAHYVGQFVEDSHISKATLDW